MVVGGREIETYKIYIFKVPKQGLRVEQLPDSLC
jgi:hypothetical protein